MKKTTLSLTVIFALHMLICNSIFAVTHDSELILKTEQTSSSFILKYGFTDNSGKVVISLTYDYAEPFSCGYALVRSGQKIYFIDKNNRVAFNSNSSEYSFYSSFCEDLCVASKDGKFGYLNKNGNVAIDFVYEDAYNFSEGLACVYKNGKAGFINKSGETVINCIYDSADSFKNGYSKVSSNGRYGFINKSGGRGTAIMYEKAADFCEDVALVKINGKYTYVDANGYIYFAPVFEEAKSFMNGSALVKISNKYGRIQKDSSFQIDPVFDFMSEMSDGYAIAGKYVYANVLQYGIIDADGNRITPLTYDSISYDDGLYTFMQSGKVSIRDKALNIVEKSK